MVALTYDVRTVRIPIRIPVPRIDFRPNAALRRSRAAARVLEPWQRAERAATERRLDAQRDAALAARR